MKLALVQAFPDLNVVVVGNAEPPRMKAFEISVGTCVCSAYICACSHHSDGPVLYPVCV
jgi:hypothetical protein